MMRAITIAATIITAACITALGGCAAAPAASASIDASREDIFVLRSVHEPHAVEGNWCDASRTGFTPLPADAERFFSFWSTESQPQTGRITDTSSRRVAQLRACLGATVERTRQNFYAEGRLGETVFRGTGECVALLLDVPEQGINAVRCHLVLSGLPAPYQAGLLTTNTLASRAAFGPDTDPPGYTQASIATLRLWHPGYPQPVNTRRIP